MKRITLVSMILTLALVFSMLSCLTLGVSAEEKKPVALYLFDDANNPGKDSSGNGNDLVVAYVDGNDSLDGVVISDGKAVFNNTGSLTAPERVDFTDSLKEATYVIKAKVAKDGKGTRTLISTGWSYHPAGFALVQNGDNMITGTYACIHRNDGDLNMEGTFMFDEWHTFVLTFSVKDNKVCSYIDGVLSAEGTAAGFESNHNEIAFTIGGFAGALEVMTGEVEEAAVFDYALSASEVSSLDLSSYVTSQNNEDNNTGDNQEDNNTGDNQNDQNDNHNANTGNSLIAVALIGLSAGGAALTLKRRKK